MTTTKLPTRRQPKGRPPRWSAHPGAYSPAALGAALKERRHARSITLEQLAAYAGYSISAIAEMESGEKVTFAKAAAVCQALDVRLSVMLQAAEKLIPTTAPSVPSRSQTQSAS